MADDNDESPSLMLQIEERMINWRINQIQSSVKKALTDKAQGDLRLEAIDLELDQLKKRADMIEDSLEQLKKDRIIPGSPSKQE